ncbi:sensor histidine kinase [Cellulomonas soli]|uniref:histidine kinase n=1 Tax=Cellulomonas soli TaxID=931535 RepID=A0A512PFA7_9CELL|nr:HAMP domain-containing sensor histidine kinase [Cellulomonas soli]NYI59325.1 two-component system OmpR family sensor kinase [Cellulomonas soli]GEP69887.1 two-component sensor histidine kinase [Cellulomonas soli]
MSTVVAPRSRAHPSRWTLRARLLVLVVGLIAVVAVLMGVVSALALRSSLVAQLDEQLTRSARLAQHAPDRGADVPSDGTSDGTSSGPSDTPSGLPTSTDGRLPDGQAAGTINAFTDGTTSTAGYIDDSTGVATFVELDAEATDALLALPADGRVHDIAIDGLGDYRALVTSSREGFTTVTAVPMSTVSGTVSDYVGVEIVVAVVALLVAGALALLLLRRELRPLARVAATATRVAELPLDRGEVTLAERVPERDTDPATEVGQVGSALNRMLGHIENALAARHESETQVRQFVADASHELRTPLASIRGYAELVRRSPEELPDGALQALGRVESESLRMTALVEDMLLLARLDAGRPLDSEPVDLTGLAIDAVADAHAAGPDHTWRLDLPGVEDSWDDDTEAGEGSEEWALSDLVVSGQEDQAEDVVVLGDDHRLRQVLANLLSNARVHTPPGTTVTVRPRREGDHVVLQVADDGPGIPPALRDRLFQRFTRGDASRNRAAGSTGLGLAIAHAVVTAHGGTIAVDSSPGSTAFTVTLPAAPEA